MTIATSAASLDLGWTELAPVSFTAGTLAGQAEIQAEVQAKLQRGTLGAATIPSTTQVQQWAVRAKEQLCEAYGFTWARRYAYADLTAGSYRFALPPDYAGGSLRIRDLTNDQWMTRVDPLRFDMSFPDVSALGSRTPGTCYYAIKDREIWLSGDVSGTTRIEMEYHREGGEVAADFDFIPEIARWRIVDFALAEAFEMLHQFDVAGYYRQKWTGEFQAAKKGDARKKWTAINFRASNWF